MTTQQLPFGARLIGQTEKTLNAILAHLLADSALSERHWIALTLTLSSPEATATDLAARVARTLKVSQPEAADVLDALAALGLLAMAGPREPITPTPAGRDLHAEVRARITAVTDRIWADISPAEQQRAAAVLNATLGRAAAELDRLSRREAQ